MKNSISISGVAALATVTCLTGCAAQMANMTSGQIGCPREEIAIYNDHTRWGSSDWTAECRGRTYICSAMTGSISCKDQSESTALESSGQEIAQKVTPKAAIAEAGCTYDTQCKGTRICEQGTCVAPAAVDATRPARRQGAEAHGSKATGGGTSARLGHGDF